MQHHERLFHENSMCSVPKQVQRGKSLKCHMKWIHKQMGNSMKLDFEGKANNKGEEKGNFERGFSYTNREEDARSS